MTRWILRLLHGGALLGLSLTAHAQTTELQAISDFTNRESGAVPYYLDIAGERNALAINAADPSYRNRFARAEHEFIGADGIYDISINALGEIDGDGTYRLLINGIVQGVAVNTPVTTDYTVIKHTFKGIALTAPTIIGVESNAVSNNTIPEGDGFAFARGRWRSVTLAVADASSNSSNSVVDLGLALSTIESLARKDGTAPIVVSVLNNSKTTIATSPVVEFSLPTGIRYNSGDSCFLVREGVRCELAELSPGAVGNASFEADITAVGWLSMSASVSSDQADSDLANNIAILSFESMEAEVTESDASVTMPEVSVLTPALTSNPPSSGNATNSSADNAEENTDSENSGALGLPSVALLLMVGLLRARREKRC